MRLVEILVPADHEDDAFDTLEELGADYVALDVGRRDASLVSVPLPSGAVDDVLGRLRNDGVEVDRYTVITDLDAAMTSHFDALEKRYAEGPDAESRIARGELRTKARELEPDRDIFVVQAVLSATVAAAGLLLNSAIAIVGSMVISPFTSSFLSVALGVVIDDFELVSDGLESQLFGLSVAVLTGVAVGLLANWTAVVPPDGTITGIEQITDFSTPGPLLLAIAVTAGGASALALATNQGVVLAGVAVAAAVVPAAAAIGIGLAWGRLTVALGAVVVLVMNIVSINVTSCLTFLLLGYRPARSRDGR